MPASLLTPILAAGLLSACTAITPFAHKTDVILSADVDPAATVCGGFVNGARLPDFAVSAGKCRILANAYVTTGPNTWQACNSAPGVAEACVTEPLSFKLTGGPK